MHTPDLQIWSRFKVAKCLDESGARFVIKCHSPGPDYGTVLNLVSVGLRKEPGCEASHILQEVAAIIDIDKGAFARLIPPTAPEFN